MGDSGRGGSGTKLSFFDEAHLVEDALGVDVVVEDFKRFRCLSLKRWLRGVSMTLWSKRSAGRAGLVWQPLTATLEGQPNRSRSARVFSIKLQFINVGRVAIGKNMSSPNLGEMCIALRKHRATFMHPCNKVERNLPRCFRFHPFFKWRQIQMRSVVRSSN